MDEREHEGLSSDEASYTQPELTDEEIHEENREAHQRAASRITYLYYQLFSLGDGAEVLEDMCQAYMERSSVDVDNPDPYLTAFCEGQRSVVLQIINFMKMGAAGVSPQ